MHRGAPGEGRAEGSGGYPGNGGGGGGHPGMGGGGGGGRLDPNMQDSKWSLTAAGGVGGVEVLPPWLTAAAPLPALRPLPHRSWTRGRAWTRHLGRPRLPSTAFVAASAPLQCLGLSPGPCQGQCQGCRHRILDFSVGGGGGRDASEGGEVPHPPPGRPAFAQPCPPDSKCQLQWHCNSNRPQPF